MPSDHQQQLKQEQNGSINGSGNGSTSDSSLSSSSSICSASSSSGEASSTSGSNVTAFLSKLWRMVNDQANSELIRWNQPGDSFIIINQIQFAKDLLPLYFKHSNMASFIRQLNMYGFRKMPLIGSNGSTDQRIDVAQFFHVNFIRDQERKLASIKRKNNSCKTHNLIVNGTFCDEVRSMLRDVKSIRDGQNSSESILGALQLDNKSLWRDVALLRNQHHKQRRVIEKLIQFLLSLIQNRNNLVKKRKSKLMLNGQRSGCNRMMASSNGTSPGEQSDNGTMTAIYGHSTTEDDDDDGAEGPFMSPCSSSNGHLSTVMMDASELGALGVQQMNLSELVGGQFYAQQEPVAAATQHLVSSLCQASGRDGVQLAAAAAAAAVAVHQVGGSVSPALSAHSQRTSGSNCDTPTLRIVTNPRQQQYTQPQQQQQQQQQQQFDQQSGSTPQRLVSATVLPTTRNSPVCSPSPVIDSQRAALLAASNANCQQWSNDIPTPATTTTTATNNNNGRVYTSNAQHSNGVAQQQQQQQQQSNNCNSVAHMQYHLSQVNDQHPQQEQQQQQQQQQHQLQQQQLLHQNGVMFSGLAAHRVPMGSSSASSSSLTSSSSSSSSTATSFLSALEQQTSSGGLMVGGDGGDITGSMNNQLQLQHVAAATFLNGHHHHNHHHLHQHQHHSNQQQQAQ